MLITRVSYEFIVKIHEFTLNMLHDVLPLDYDECNADPCENNSTCSEADPGLYDCACTDGYEGQNCETGL